MYIIQLAGDSSLDDIYVSAINDCTVTTLFQKQFYCFNGGYYNSSTKSCLIIVTGKNPIVSVVGYSSIYGL